MKYTIIIKRIETPKGENRYPDTVSVYEQTVEREHEETFVKSIVEAVNTREVPLI
jgi:hypothetical protein